MVLPVEIDGVVGQYHFEYTSSVNQEHFRKAISTIVEISEKTTPYVLADVSNFNIATYSLRKLALGTDPVTDQPLQVPITAGMARAIGSIINLSQSIQPVIGLTNFNGLGFTADLDTWRDLYFQGLREVLVPLVSVNEVSTRTLQSFVELEYVKTGNEVLFQELSSLKDAMTVTEEALDLLGRLQDLKNRAQIEDRDYTGPDNWENYISGDAKQATEQYYNATKNALGQPLLIFTDPAFQSEIISQGIALENEIVAVVGKLDALDPSGVSDSSSLRNQLLQIKADMDASAYVDSILFWVIDNHTDLSIAFSDPAVDTAKAGVFQRRLSSTIASFQALNDSQKVDLQSTFFNFEEFYKSASMMLRSLNRVVEKIASQVKNR